MLFMPFLRLKVTALHRLAPVLLLSLALSACGGGGGGNAGDGGVNTNVNSCLSNAGSTFCGTVSGLPSGESIILDLSTSDAGSNSLTLTANGPFSMGLIDPLDITTSWTLGVRIQPSAQTSCSVTSQGNNLNSEGLKTTSVAGIVVTCSPAVYYTVGGLLNGLDSGAQVTLGSLDAADDTGDSLTLTANGTFTFPAIRGAIEGYAVGVTTQPANQVCTVTNGSGYPLVGDVNDILINCVDKYSVGGTLTGLISGGQVTLQDNGGDSLNLTANGPFTFATHIVDGGTYDATLQAQPAQQACTVSDGSGTVSGAVTSVQVSCTTIEHTLYTFTGGNDGLQSFAGMIMDSSGNLYGTTASGGDGHLSNQYCDGCGTVFRLAPDGSGGYTESILYNFTNSSDGGYPEASLIMDSSGNLYGTTWAGGKGISANCDTAPGGCGTVFELAPNGSGGYTESVLYAFTGITSAGSDGQNPASSLIMDAAGDLYGTTQAGGADSNGIVFELKPNGGGGYTESILYNFTGGSDGGSPTAGLIMDSAGNLYGTTSEGGGLSGTCGAIGCGTVFKLAPNGGAYTESVLYAFTGGNDGAQPRGTLLLDGSGNLYSTAESGGKGSEGTVFELSPNGSGGYSESVLYAFNFVNDAEIPLAGVIMDSAGNLYGSGIHGGDFGNGAVFKLTPNAAGGGYTESVYYAGAGSYGGLVMDSAGDVFGTTVAGPVFDIYPH